MKRRGFFAKLLLGVVAAPQIAKTQANLLTEKDVEDVLADMMDGSLNDVIYKVQPTETPLMSSNRGKSSIDNTEYRDAQRTLNNAARDRLDKEGYTPSTHWFGTVHTKSNPFSSTE